jgi:magnesium transporter
MINVMLYNKSTQQHQSGGAELIDVWQTNPQMLMWIDFSGHDIEAEHQLMTETFKLHPLAVQDAQRDRHPPKMEVFENHTFLLLKGFSADSDKFEFRTLQLALFIGERFLITRHNTPSPSAVQLHQELSKNSSRFQQGPDAIAMRLCRILVGRYLTVLLALEPRLEELEEIIVKHPHDQVLAELIGLKSELKKFRRVFLYHNQIFTELKSKSHPGFNDELEHEIIDVYEQQERATSLANLYYELASDLIEGYISVASHRLNQIMKILTIITAIFVPLSFLAGIYGMNFEYMPELHSRSGYFILLGIMLFIATVLLTVFRKKRWL